MGKDVVTFLAWAAEPEMEERKLVGLSNFFIIIIIIV
jgi:ubiquinol-cytochrome c reductase cytochrome c1 subunit